MAFSTKCAYASSGHSASGSAQAGLSVYISHEPDESKKNSALCVGVIEGDALVTVALGVSERVALSETEAELSSDEGALWPVLGLET